jgi:zinc protease
MSNTKVKTGSKKINANVEFVAEQDGVAEYRLKNGLKVLLVENNTAPVITLLVLYKVGSRNEGVGYTGATHFLEHMLFKGTKEHNPEQGNGIDVCLHRLVLIGTPQPGSIVRVTTKWCQMSISSFA